MRLIGDKSEDLPTLYAANELCLVVDYVTTLEERGKDTVGFLTSGTIAIGYLQEHKLFAPRARGS